MAQKVLEGKTKGYRNHPQLERFKKHPDSVAAIGAYLTYVYGEALERGFNFDKQKIAQPYQSIDRISVSKGQLEFEFKLLKEKVRVRDPKQYEQLLTVTQIEPNPLFKVVEGGRESWEKAA